MNNNMYVIYMEYTNYIKNMNNTSKIMIALFFTLILIVCLMIVELSTNKNYHEQLYPTLYELPTTNEEIDLSNEYIKKGYLRAAQSKIAICCLVRNNAKIVNKSKIRLEHIGKYFKDYKIIMFENDSDDNTRELLKEWRKENSNVILLDCCDDGNCDCKLKHMTGYSFGYNSSQRLSRMARFRENYLNYVKKSLNDYDYMLVVDFDLNGNADINGLFDSIAKDDWGAIFCNGRTSMPGSFGAMTIPYDSLAYLDENSGYENVQVSLSSLSYNTLSMIYMTATTHFGRVKSAFNGYGLYKIKILNDCSYIGNDSLCEHINLANCIDKKNEKMFINSKWQGYFDRQGDNPYKILTVTPL